MVQAPEAGFQFDLAKRNAYLEAKGVKAPAPWKTGTTIAGIIFKVRKSCYLYQHLRESVRRYLATSLRQSGIT